MNDPAIPKPITDLVTEMFDTIPGVTVDKIGWTDMPGTGRSIMVKAQGWSPALTRRHRTWKQDVAAAHARAKWIAEGRSANDVDGTLVTAASIPPEIHREAMQLDGQQIADVLRPCFEHVAFVQRMLSRTGHACGLHEPTPRPASADEVDLEPLAIDRRLADLVVLRHGADDAVAMIEAAVMKALAGDNSRMEDVIETSTGGVTAYLGDPRMWLGVTIAKGRPGMLVDAGDAPSGGVLYDGTWVTVGDELPETIIASAAGRPLGQIIETGMPGFDDAVVKEAFHDGEGGTAFEMPGGDVRIVDHPELGPALTRRLISRATLG